MVANVSSKKYQNVYKLFESRIEPYVSLGSDVREGVGALGQWGGSSFYLRGDREIPQKGVIGNNKKILS